LSSSETQVSFDMQRWCFKTDEGRPTWKSCRFRRFDILALLLFEGFLGLCSKAYMFRMWNWRIVWEATTSTLPLMQNQRVSVKNVSCWWHSCSQYYIL